MAPHWRWNDSCRTRISYVAIALPFGLTASGSGKWLLLACFAVAGFNEAQLLGAMRWYQRASQCPANSATDHESGALRSSRVRRTYANAIALAGVDPVGDLAGGQVQHGDHVPDPAGGPVAGRQPGRMPGGPPAAAVPGLQVQRTEFIEADHPAVRGRVVIQVQDPAHLGDEVGVGGGLPGLGGLPADPRRTAGSAGCSPG
jgi:hypothetical protein